MYVCMSSCVDMSNMNDIKYNIYPTPYGPTPPPRLAAVAAVVAVADKVRFYREEQQQLLIKKV